MQNASRYFLSVKNNAFSLLCTLTERNFWHLSLTVRSVSLTHSSVAPRFAFLQKGLGVHFVP